MLLVLSLLGGCASDDDTASEGPSIPAPLALQVGAARTRMPVPVGAGTIGNFGLDTTSEPSPFADKLTATTRLHSHPDFRAVVISRGGPHEVIFLRSDTMNVFQHVRLDLANELEQRLGRNINDNLILSATHTHSGPGGMVNADGILALGFGTYNPEFYDRMIDAMADTVESAYADLKPGRVGHVFADASGALSDRRCEDGLPDHVNGNMPVLAVEQEGQLRALVATLAVHGTVLGVSDLTLSGDVSSAVEAAIEHGFDTDVQVQVHNAWAADVAPGRPTVPQQSGYPALPSGHDHMDAVGAFVADAVHTALLGLDLQDEPEVWAEVHGVELSREAIGYGANEFSHEYGGLYCSFPGEDCDISTDYEAEFDDKGCVPLPVDYAEFGINQTEMSVGRVGALHLVTWPGEPGTVLAETLIDRLATAYDDVSDVMFIGYAQDYNGYSILEDDWWQGGYEATGAMWGPRQGQYLSDELVRIFGLYRQGKRDAEPEPVSIPEQLAYSPYESPTPVDVGTVITEVLPSYTEADLVTFAVNGTNPWHGAPIATLEDGAGNAVTRPNGRPIHSDGRGFWVDLTVDPPYERPETVSSRAFQWHFHMPVARPTVGVWPTLSGDYRLRVQIPDGSGGHTEVASAVFTVL